jgi:hypothetical protein
MELVLTVSEVARVLRTLEGRFALTPRGIRYYARTGMVEPSGRMTRGKTARTTRLYGLADVALLRLVCQLRRQRAHERAVWGLLVYRGEELRALIAQGSGEFVVAIPAALGIGSEDLASPKAIRIHIASLVRGLAERMTAYRQRNPEVWTGLQWMDAAQALRQITTGR